ncbi:MAG: FAD-dependent oxidoreductase [Candidatus Pacearchaeota archaeon]|nr:FAD-dependent oxidoreductase [Candidatus Pacearchaeota archaeon]
MESYDLVILGAGGSGLAGAMYAARLGLSTLVLGASSGTELSVGGAITTTNIVENYPGFIKISGHELAKKIEEHAKSYKNVMIKKEKVISINKIGGGFSVKTDKTIYKSKTILFATGTRWKKLEIPGSKEFENKGVSYCALCDALLYKNKIVAVVGGSNSAAKNALLLAEYAKKVYIIYKGERIHPESVYMGRIKLNKKIEVVNNTNIIRINGDKTVKSVTFDKPHKNKKELNLDGVFVDIGHVINSELAEKLGVKVSEKKEIIINHKTSETNIPGIFAAGDVTDKQFKQLITGVADACAAAYSAYEYITKEKVEKY